MNLFMDLKLQILETIEQLESIDEKLVLNYRYVKGLEWDEICSLLFASERTIFRWHGNALAKLKLPEKPINIKNCQLMAVGWQWLSVDVIASNMVWYTCQKYK